MSTMNVSLPESLKTFVDEQVGERGYGSSSEYIRELIRKEQDRVYLRGLLLEGATSAAGPQPDKEYFDDLRRSLRRHVRRRR
jgi:antitoxin ParD1/3/4